MEKNNHLLAEELQLTFHVTKNESVYSHVLEKNDTALRVSTA